MTRVGKPELRIAQDRRRRFRTEVFEQYQLAIRINREGRRCVLAVDTARRESQTSWKDFLLELKLCDRVEASIEETLTFHRLPRRHHKHMKSSSMLERLNEEIKRRTRVIGIFPNEASCLRLARACALETHENWIEAPQYLTMESLEERRRALRREAV